MLNTLKKLFLLFFIAVFIAIPILYFVVDWERLQPRVNSQTYLDKLEETALSGDLDAMHRMGNNYRYGYNGVKINFDEAVKWYKLSAESGYAEAINSLAIMYQQGEGVGQSYEKAVVLFEKAEAMDNTNAQINLGHLYAQGLHFSQNFDRAFTLYLKAAEKHNVQAMYKVGFQYLKGQGVPQDFEKAYDWFLKSAEKGNANAQFRVGIFYDQGIGRIEKDRSKARIWYEKANYQSHDSAQRYLAFIYFDGAGGVSKDYLKAGEYFSLSARNGNKKARDLIEFNSSKCIEFSSEKLFFRDMKSCYLAAFSDNSIAMYAVGRSYYYGDEGVGQDIDYLKAYEWFKRSAQAGYSGGQYRLALHYLNGEGTKKDIIEGHAWLYVSLEQNDLPEPFINTARKIIKSMSSDLSVDDLNEISNRSKEYIDKYINPRK